MNNTAEADLQKEDFQMFGNFLFERPGATAREISETWRFYTEEQAAAILCEMRKAGLVINEQERNGALALDGGDVNAFYLNWDYQNNKPLVAISEKESEVNENDR